MSRMQGSSKPAPSKLETAERAIRGYAQDLMELCEEVGITSMNAHVDVEGRGYYSFVGWRGESKVLTVRSDD